MLVLDFRKLPKNTQFLGSRDELQILLSMMLNSISVSPDSFLKNLFIIIIIFLTNIE